MRNIAIKGIIFYFIIIFSLVNAYPVLSQTIPFHETDLYPGGQAMGIKVGLTGTIFVLDQANEIWKVNPSTGDYLDFYPVGSGNLMDVSLEGSEKIWWADDGTGFGYFDLSTNVDNSWSVDVLNPGANPLNLGPLVVNGSNVWMASWYGPAFGLFKFDSVTTNLCLYQIPSGLYAADLIIHDGFLWLLDWTSDSLLRFDPENGQLMKYATGRNIQSSANLQSDNNIIWWTEDILDGDLVRFNPATAEMKNFNLPEGEFAVNLSLSNGKVWYTDLNGSIGKLDPQLAEVSTTTLDGQLIAAGITPVCSQEPLGSPSEYSVSPVSGTFNWVESSSTLTEPLTGIQNFSMPVAATPYGIAASGDFVWVSDQGRQKLIRLPNDDQDNGYSLFLPLILR